MSQLIDVLQVLDHCNTLWGEGLTQQAKPLWAIWETTCSIPQDGQQQVFLRQSEEVPLLRKDFLPPKLNHNQTLTHYPCL
jgi:hypothetical protein